MRMLWTVAAALVVMGALFSYLTRPKPLDCSPPDACLVGKALMSLPGPR